MVPSHWWAAHLGGPRAGFYTGWLNLIGLLAVTASVVYACASFMNVTLGLFSAGWSTTLGDDALLQAFVLFVVLLIVVALLNIFSSHLLAVFNNISAYWHVFGSLAVVLILLLTAKDYQSASFVFTERINNSCFSEGMYWWYVLPLGFLLAGGWILLLAFLLVAKDTEFILRSRLDRHIAGMLPAAPRPAAPADQR